MLILGRIKKCRLNIEDEMKVDFSETEFIRTWEGFSLSSYRCSAGVLTCGWGCTGPDILADTVWTEEYAKERFMKEIDLYCEKLTKCLPPNITKNRFLACLSLSYNIGLPAFQASTLLKCLKVNDYGGAAEQFLVWSKISVNGKKIFNKGLHNRRKAEQLIFLKG